MVSRYDVRKEIEKALDKTQPIAVRQQSWGVQMDRGQFERMRAAQQEAAARRRAKKARAAKGGS